MKKVVSVAGTRPNFMKVAPIHRALQPYASVVQHILVHTGQHYDYNMSELFFRELELPEPDVYLGVGSGRHGEQTGKILIAFETVLLEYQPDLVVVVGDVNSTIACALAASKLHIPVAHVEAGLRSFDRRMPEEINRIATDAIADYAFVTEQSGVQNLLREGWDESRIFFVGNTMIDSLHFALPRIQDRQIVSALGLKPQQYAVVTLHRPSNVDDPVQLQRLFQLLHRISQHRTIVFPMHPRTRKNAERWQLLPMLEGANVLLLEPIGYFDFIALVKQADFVLTDSGGIQEEATVLQVPCVTLRTTTERPVTIELGTNVLVEPTDIERAWSVVEQILAGKKKIGTVPPLWDGRAAERIVRIIVGDILGVSNFATETVKGEM